MPRLAFVFRTDTHVYDKSPVSWKADYPEEIWSNLTEVGRLAREHDAVAVLDGGDFFHVKAATRNPPWLLERAARIHREYPCPVYSVEGNHDMAYNRLDSIPSQPLGVLFAAGVFQPMRDQVFEDGDLRVRVVGVPYHPARTVAEIRERLRKQPGDTFLVGVVHQLAALDPPPSVEDFFGEPVFRYEDVVEEGGADALAFGHWHKDQGIVPVRGVPVINTGALSRGSLIRENLERIPCATLIEVLPSGVMATRLPMPVAPAEDVFDLDRKSRVDHEAVAVAEFAARLRAQTAQKGDDVLETTLAQLAFAVDVRECVQDYLERARENRR